MGCTHSSVASAKLSTLSSEATNAVPPEPDEHLLEKQITVTAQMDTEESTISDNSIDRVSHNAFTSLLRKYWYYFTKENECRMRNDRIHAEMLRRCRPCVLHVPFHSTLQIKAEKECECKTENCEEHHHQQQQPPQHVKSNNNNVFKKDKNFMLYEQLNWTNIAESNRCEDDDDDDHTVDECNLLSLNEINLALYQFKEYIDSQCNTLNWRTSLHYQVNTAQNSKCKNNDKTTNNNTSINKTIKEECTFAVCNLIGEIRFKDATNTSFVIPFKLAVLIPYHESKQMIVNSEFSF